MSNNYTFISIRSIADEHLLKTNTSDPFRQMHFCCLQCSDCCFQTVSPSPYLLFDLTIRNKNQRTLIVRRAGLSSCCTGLGLSESERPINLEWGRSSIWARMQTGRNQGSGCPTFGPDDKYTDTQVIGKIGQISGKYPVLNGTMCSVPKARIIVAIETKIVTKMLRYWVNGRSMATTMITMIMMMMRRK